jgi:hypothetical protein
MAIITTSDFSTGRYSIPTDAYSGLQAYIDRVEPLTLKKILGYNLYQLFLADLAGSPSVPVSAIYLAIFNQINIDNDYTYSNEGMKEMLKGFIYFEYMRDNVYHKTRSGVMQSTSENAENKGYNGYNLVQAYNEAVESANVISYYILDNNTLYTTYNGEYLKTISGY